MLSVFLILFVLVDAFYLTWIYQKGHHTKNFFRVSTLFSNIFAPHIQNLETAYFFLSILILAMCEIEESLYRKSYLTPNEGHGKGWSKP